MDHKENAKLRAAVMLAYADGKEIEWRNNRRGFSKTWEDAPNPTWNWDSYDYRVKPVLGAAKKLMNDLIELTGGRSKLTPDLIREFIAVCTLRHPSLASCEEWVAMASAVYDDTSHAQVEISKLAGKALRPANSNEIEKFMAATCEPRAKNPDESFLDKLELANSMLNKGGIADLGDAMAVLRELKQRPDFKIYESAYRNFVQGLTKEAIEQLM